MLNATLVRRINVTPELAIFQVKPDKGVDDFKPGQYVALGLPGSAPRPDHFPVENVLHEGDKLIKRAYSIGSPPSEKNHLEFYIAIVPTGALSSRLAMLKEGDRLFTAPKIIGTFTMCDVKAEKNLVLVATGTGLAPFMSMIRTPEVSSANRAITIIHGVRYKKDFAYREELLAFQERHSKFKYNAYVSREESVPGYCEKGYVQHHFTSGKIVLNPEQDHVFVCGNPAMIDDLEKLLTSQGYISHSKRTPGSLHIEKYW